MVSKEFGERGDAGAGDVGLGDGRFDEAVARAAPDANTTCQGWMLDFDGACIASSSASDDGSSLRVRAQRAVGGAQTDFVDGVPAAASAQLRKVLQDTLFRIADLSGRCSLCSTWSMRVWPASRANSSTTDRAQGRSARRCRSPVPEVNAVVSTADRTRSKRVPSESL